MLTRLSVPRLDPVWLVLYPILENPPADANPFFCLSGKGSLLDQSVWGRVNKGSNWSSRSSFCHLSYRYRRSNRSSVLRRLSSSPQCPPSLISKATAQSSNYYIVVSKLPWNFHFDSSPSIFPSSFALRQRNQPTQDFHPSFEVKLSLFEFQGRAGEVDRRERALDRRERALDQLCTALSTYPPHLKSINGQAQLLIADS